MCRLNFTNDTRRNPRPAIYNNLYHNCKNLEKSRQSEILLSCDFGLIVSGINLGR
jgi:hypothetical protein